MCAPGSQAISQSCISAVGGSRRGGGLQQPPGTLEGCSQERRKEPGPLPGEAAWGKDRPPPLQTSCNSQISCNSASLKAQGSPIRATGLHLLVREGCQRHKHNFQNPWEPCPALRSHSGPIGGPAWEAHLLEQVFQVPPGSQVLLMEEGLVLQVRCVSSAPGLQNAVRTPSRGASGRDHFLRLVTFI